MKNLQDFQSSLPADCILDATSSDEIKGGFRFVTEDVYKFINKVYSLLTQGKTIDWGIHGNKYCVEW